MAIETESLLNLPREMLEIIFGHFDLESSKDAALISPSIYKMICYSQRNRPQCLALRLPVSLKRQKVFASTLKLYLTTLKL